MDVAPETKNHGFGAIAFQNLQNSVGYFRIGSIALRNNTLRSNTLRSIALGNNTLRSNTLRSNTLRSNTLRSIGLCDNTLCNNHPARQQAQCESSASANLQGDPLLKGSCQNERLPA
jgi:hypothetical protein